MSDKKLIPLVLIRIVKNINATEMAQYFEISNSYINSMTNGSRRITEETLNKGLNNLGIELQGYKELDEFCKELKESGLDYQDQYHLGLIKAIGIVSPALKSETERLLNKRLLVNNTEIITYIKMAQEYELLDAEEYLLIMPKHSDNKDALKPNKYISIKELGVSIEKYQELKDTFRLITASQVQEESKCKLLATLGILNPQHKKAIVAMLNKLLNDDQNKVKKK